MKNIYTINENINECLFTYSPFLIMKIINNYPLYWGSDSVAETRGNNLRIFKWTIYPKF